MLGLTIKSVYDLPNGNLSIISDNDANLSTSGVNSLSVRFAVPSVITIKAEFINDTLRKTRKLNNHGSNDTQPSSGPTIFQVIDLRFEIDFHSFLWRKNHKAGSQNHLRYITQWFSRKKEHPNASTILFETRTRFTTSNPSFSSPGRGSRFFPSWVRSFRMERTTAHHDEWGKNHDGHGNKSKLEKKKQLEGKMIFTHFIYDFIVLWRGGFSGVHSSITGGGRGKMFHLNLDWISTFILTWC